MIGGSVTRDPHFQNRLELNSSSYAVVRATIEDLTGRSVGAGRGDIPKGLYGLNASSVMGALPNTTGSDMVPAIGTSSATVALTACITLLHKFLARKAAGASLDELKRLLAQLTQEAAALPLAARAQLGPLPKL